MVYYTTESDTEYTKEEIMELCGNDPNLFSRVMALATWQHIETILEELSWDDADETGCE